jgi:8-oxo-dGTP pyrophosphatase MutT (NUDIX family)
VSGHITGSAWLVDTTGSRVVLTHHKKLGKRLQLGGHADGNSDVLSVALREATEESGLRDIVVVAPTIFDLDVHPIPERANEPSHRHYDLRFALQATGSDKFQVSAESNQLAWVDIDRVADYTDEPALLRMAAKWRVFLNR